MYKLIFIIGITSIFPIFAWDGYDNEAGESIEIDKDSLVRKDKDIKVYHWDDGSYHDEEVEGIHENRSVAKHILDQQPAQKLHGRGCMAIEGLP